MIVQNRFKIKEIIEGSDKENYVDMMFSDHIIRKIPNGSKITMVEQPVIVLNNEESKFTTPTYIYFNDIKNAASETIFLPMYYCDENTFSKSIITEQLEVVYRDYLYILLKHSLIKDNDYYEAPTFFCFEYDNDINSRCHIPCFGITNENMIRYDSIVTLNKNLVMSVSFESCITIKNSGSMACDSCMFNPNDGINSCHDVNWQYDYPRQATIYPKDIDSIPKDDSSNTIHTKITERKNESYLPNPYEVYLDIKFQTKS